MHKQNQPGSTTLHSVVYIAYIICIRVHLNALFLYTTTTAAIILPCLVLLCLPAWQSVSVGGFIMAMRIIVHSSLFDNSFRWFVFLCWTIDDQCSRQPAKLCGGIFSRLSVRVCVCTYECLWGIWCIWYFCFSVVRYGGGDFLLVIEFT